MLTDETDCQPAARENWVCNEGGVRCAYMSLHPSAAAWTTFAVGTLSALKHDTTLNMCPSCRVLQRTTSKVALGQNNSASMMRYA